MKPTVKIGNSPNTSKVYAATALNPDRHIISTDKAYDKVPGLILYSSMPVPRWSTRIMLISTVPMTSTRVNSLNSEKGKKNNTDLVIKRSKELYGYTPEEKSDENIEWMLRNGYIKEKRNRRGTRRKP